MKSQEQQHQDCTNRFIELANDMKSEGIDPALVNGALMSASAIYATYVSAGNEGALESSGVDKVVNLFRHTLERFQQLKKNELMKQRFQ